MQHYIVKLHRASADSSGQLQPELAGATLVCEKTDTGLVISLEELSQLDELLDAELAKAAEDAPRIILAR